MRSFKVAAKVLTFLVVFFVLTGIAGHYLEPPRTTTRILLQELYTQEEEITTLLAGASRFRRGIDPYIIEEQLGGNALMLAFGTQTPIDSYYLVNEALKTNTPEVVVLDMSYRTMVEWDVTRSDLIWAEFAPSWDKVNYFFSAIDPDDYLSTLFPVFSDDNRDIFQSDDFDIAENLREKESEAYQSYDFSYATTDKSTYAGKGYIYVKKPIETGTLGNTSFARWDEANIEAKKVGYYDKTIALCKERGVEVILIDMPMPLASLTGQKSYAEYEAYVKAYAESREVPYINFCFLRKELYPQSDAFYFDRNHMSYEGSQRFSPILAQVIGDFLRDDLELSDYLYGTYEETLEAYPQIYSTWMTEEEDGQILRAKSYRGIDVKAEYQFLYKETKNAEYQVIREYDKGTTIDISAYTKGYIRSNCRTAGTESEWEQYYEHRIR